jgi:hypothetical protein
LTVPNVQGKAVGSPIAVWQASGINKAGMREMDENAMAVSTGEQGPTYVPEDDA